LSDTLLVIRFLAKIADKPAFEHLITRTDKFIVQQLMVIYLSYAFCPGLRVDIGVVVKINTVYPLQGKCLLQNQLQQ